MAIKRAWIVCGFDGHPLIDEKTDAPAEFKSEAAAIKRAKDWVKTSGDDEAWIFRLSHVVSRPDVEPTVEAVK
jgi:hypothetical protein